MIAKLFGGKSKDAAAPDGERLYAIGDIHGCAILLENLLEIIESDASGAPHRLIFLGDYVDRGPDSKAVIDALVALKAARPDAVFLKGNHEQAMLSFLERAEHNEEWLHWGGDKTLESYGVEGIWRRHPEEVAAEFSTLLPTAHRDFLSSLDLWRVFGDYVFVHAGLKPGVALDEQSEQDCLWIRAEFHNAPADKRPKKFVVHGHHPVRKPVDTGWRIDVDTGAVWSDALSAVVLEGTTRRFISTGKI